LKNKLKGNGIGKPGFVSVTNPSQRLCGLVFKNLPPTIPNHPLPQPAGF
jgi:hypothetical protein